MRKYRPKSAILREGAYHIFVWALAAGALAQGAITFALKWPPPEVGAQPSLLNAVLERLRDVPLWFAASLGVLVPSSAAIVKFAGPPWVYKEAEKLLQRMRDHAMRRGTKMADDPQFYHRVTLFRALPGWHPI